MNPDHPTDALIHPVVQRVLHATAAAEPADEAAFDAWAAAPGVAMALIVDDPRQHKETLDLAVIVPELLALHRTERIRVAWCAPPLARALAVRYGVARWPALVLLRDGAYLGAVDGVRDWDDYVGATRAALAAAPRRPPGVGIAVRAVGAAEGAAPCAG